MSTFILKWNPEFSSFQYHSYLDVISDPEEMALNWSIYEWSKVKPGDRVFFLRVGARPQLLASGYIIGPAYQDEDWSGKGRETYYADIFFDVACHPDYKNVITGEILEEAIPLFNWRSGHSGVVLDDANALTLEKLWMTFLYNNRDDFYLGGLVLDENHEDDLDESRDVLFGDKIINLFVGITALNAYSFEEMFGDSRNTIMNRVLQGYFCKERGDTCEICGYDYRKVFGDQCKRRPTYIYIDKGGNNAKSSWEDHFTCVCPSCEAVLNEERLVFNHKLKTLKKGAK